jgi:hypothetical protein
MLEKRKAFVADYVRDNPKIQMKVIVINLSERLFLSERTINTILAEIRNDLKK